MRVLVITTEFPPLIEGGLGTHVHQLASGLAQSGCKVDVFVIARGAQHPPINGYNLTVRFISNPEIEPEVPSVGNIKIANERLGSAIKAYIEGGGPRPDVIHVHECYGCSAAMEIGSMLGCPVISTVHFLLKPIIQLRQSTFSEADPTFGEVIEWERSMYSQCQAVIAVSRSVARALVDDYGIPNSKVTVIYDGFDTTTFSKPTPTRSALESCRRELGIGADPVVIFAGRIDPQKGLSGLFRSAKRVLRTTEATYLIAGRAPKAAPGYGEMLQAMVSGDKLLSKKVRFLGFQSRERLILLYSLAYVAVVPSLYEPFGYAATEAMSLGLAVVATDTGGLSEIVEHEKCGLLVPLTKCRLTGAVDIHVEQFGDAQTRLLKSPTLRSEFGSAARTRVTTMFSLDQMIQKTTDLYCSASGSQQS